MSDQQQILRLLATIREEVGGIRSRQEELYELLISYKDQLHELKQTVVDGLAGLPKSPYIAGQLVPIPRRIDAIEDLEGLLKTYLHGSPPEDDPPIDTVFDPPPEVKPEDVELEAHDDPPRRRERSGGGGGGGQRHDRDLERGPDRDVVPLDLDDDKKKKSRRRSRGRGRKRGKDEGGDKDAPVRARAHDDD